MSRLLLIAAVLTATGCSGCSKSAGSQDKGPSAPPAEGGTKIAVPGGEPAGGGSGQKVAPPGSGFTDDPRFHLHADEGTLTIDKAEGKAGTEVTAGIKVAPAAGYHINTEYPIKIKLEAPDGVKLAKAEFIAGGRDKAAGDAVTLTEQQLTFAIKATADKAGAYEIKGLFSFAVCEKESCRPKKQPITIAVAAQ